MSSTDNTSVVINELTLYLQRLQNCQLTTILQDKTQNEVLSILVEKSNCFWENTKEKDVDVFFMLLVKAISSQPESEVLDLKVQIFHKLNSSNTMRPQSCLTLLNLLYNAFESVDWKVKTFGSILKIAWENQLFSAVKLQLLCLDKLMLSWNCEERCYREIYEYASRFFPDNWAQYTIKWLSTFDAEESQVFCEQIKSLVIELIKRESILIYDKICACTAIQIVDSRLFELLSLLLSGTLRDFDAYLLKNRKFIESSGISVSELTDKFYILTLISSLARQKYYTYDQIASILGVETDLVEHWVIAAISKGLLNAKLNQVNETIYVVHVVDRQIAKSTWVSIKEQLDSWQSSIQTLVECNSKGDFKSLFRPPQC